MATATMTSKGQLTVPKEVRDELGLAPGTTVTFTRNVEGDYVLTTRTSGLSALAGSLGYRGPALSVEEMDRAVADGVGERLA